MGITLSVQARLWRFCDNKSTPRILYQHRKGFGQGVLNCQPEIEQQDYRADVKKIYHSRPFMTTQLLVDLSIAKFAVLCPDTS
jgi:hypothetical protein